MSHNNQKKIAVINDISGFGKCSIAVALPIISHMGIQCCPLPTSIFSNHTGFDSFYYEDFTGHMEQYINEWKKLDLKFSAIASGFFGSDMQIEIVEGFIHYFKDDNTIIVIDPVMGDNGHAYPTYTKKMCEEMKRLVALADILTPNLTEACILTDTPYKHEGWTKSELLELLEKLNDIGAKKIVITGIHFGNFLGNAIYDDGKFYIQKQKKAGRFRSGTGDIFSAIIAADAVNGVAFIDSVKKASTFIKRCIAETEKLDIPLTDGVCFEELLPKLKRGLLH